jgi:hypothetical protein
MQVYMACRSAKRGREAVDALKEEIPDAKVCGGACVCVWGGAGSPNYVRQLSSYLTLTAARPATCARIRTLDSCSHSHAQTHDYPRMWGVLCSLPSLGLSPPHSTLTFTRCPSSLTSTHPITHIRHHHSHFHSLAGTLAFELPVPSRHHFHTHTHTLMLHTRLSSLG